MARTSRPTDFRHGTPAERRDLATRAAGLPDGALTAVTGEGGLTPERAETMIENVVGVLGVPLGIATNFIVNDLEVLVPMATEEPSVVAAASHAARIARASGGFHASTSAPVMQAQIQVLDVPDPQAARLRVLAAREELMAAGDAQDPSLVSFGGGVRDIVARTVPTRVGTHLLVHLVVDVRDAMGANAVNTMAEALAPRIAELAGGRPLLRILTNKADQRLARAHAVLDATELGGPRVVRDMVAAGALAEADPYRAATHNKGIMNGITAVALATGNDTRAIEAGAHSHAVGPDGRYGSLSHFEETADGDLAVSLELPMAVGIIGGATKTHPSAGAALQLMGITDAAQLAEVITSVGLAQNVAALRALATEGIQRGHMTLHRRSVASAQSDAS
ncbi:hydroxymethylglutaryl-CoA reductase, degradative [Janibacter corallicola]|uniref:hydroxymethylglutaryl-CoA reductase, degradative n=1 Tax=Janibacter corallicola TaxID=415212 RepID=UPI000A039508|nr:hydroxymethylglutaryl-CoA reductase, degradative [Janibacter corallicola]